MISTMEKLMARCLRSFMLFSLVALIYALSAPVAVTQDARDNFDRYPLRPADTSSPRDTLRSFLNNMDEVIHDLRQSGFTRKSARAYRRAVQTLDLSTTPHSDSWEVRSERVVLLQEILDRIELPPDEAIPGDDEIAGGAVTQWIIPDTGIKIQRIEDGPRAGEFLFSADTVQRLHRSFKHAKHLPYKSGVTGGFYEDWRSSGHTILALEQQVRNRLKPVDASDPRSTLDGFLDSVNRAYTLVMGADAALKALPPQMTTADAYEIEETATNLLQRAITTLDLSQVPEALREDVGIETALQLKEIFDRMRLPPLDMVPNAQMVAAARQGVNESSSRAAEAVRWRYPNTAIEIVEIMQGERQGQFLFSADTVDRVSEYYRDVQSLPYRTGPISIDYTSPDNSVGFYEFYRTTPGYLAPYAHVFGRFVDNLPDWSKTVYSGQTLWQWLGLLLSVLIFILAAFLVHLVIRRTERRLESPGYDWLVILAPIATAAIVKLVVGFIDNDLNITGDVLAIVTTGGSIVVIATLAWAVYLICKAIAETIITSPRIPDESIDATLLRLAARVAGFLIGTWILIKGVHDLGLDIVPLLAGLGVGGLAVALAARPTLENVIGSFMIFADKPFRIGQRVTVMGQNGTVEAIGLRSTKIRLLNGHLTAIPNEKMASVEVENIGRRPYIRRDFNVSITYDTPPEKINRAVEILREILAVPKLSPQESTDSIQKAEGKADDDYQAKHRPHPNEAINRPDFPPRVYFNELAADSLNIRVIYWYHPPEYWDQIEHAHWINVQIMERFNAEGIDFAFPTQTLYLAGDEKRPLTVGRRLISED